MIEHLRRASKMIRIIKRTQTCRKIKKNHTYSLYINETHKVDFDHFREPEDLSRVLREAADAIDLQNGITPPHLSNVKKEKPLTMMERMNGIQYHLQKQNMDH